MTRYLTRQLPQLLGVVLLVCTAVFFLSHLSGDPSGVLLPPDATFEEVAALRERYGLDRPVLERFGTWLSNALHGDLGQSILVGRRPAFDLVAERLPRTFQLAGLGLLFGAIVAVPLGVVAALKRGGWVDRLASTFVLIGQAMPSFWFGIMLILIFSVRLQWFPASGVTHGWRGLVLPVTTLAISQAPPIMRMVRSSMIEILGQDYIRTAKAKGLSPFTVTFKHALRNAAVPVVTMIALRLASLVNGAVIVEIVFGWPGLGMLLVSSINQADFPVLQAAVLFIALGVVVANLLGDIVVSKVDRRIAL